MQVIVGAMLVNALHAALEDAEKPFNGVGVDSAIIAADILAYFMLNHIVRRKFITYLLVDIVVIGHENSFTIHVLSDDWNEG